MDFVERFHKAVDLLHRAIDERMRHYLLREAENARLAAKELGQSAGRVRWSYHPQPKTNRRTA